MPVAPKTPTGIFAKLTPLEAAVYLLPIVMLPQKMIEINNPAIFELFGSP
jgi:hypothetical protein